MMDYKDMVNEEFDENEENISPSILNCVEGQNLRRQRGSISVGSALLKASVCGKQRHSLISKQRTTEDGQNVSEAQKVHLKDRDGCICAQGIVDVTIRNGEQIGGLTLFPHQCAVCIEHVFQSNKVPTDETGRPLSECIGQYIWWAKRQVQHVSEDVQSREVSDNGKSHFDFNDDDVIDNDFFCKEVKKNDSGKIRESTIWTRDGSMRKTSIMDGLPAPPPKREYMMTNRVPRIIRGRKIGASRDTKCELHSVRATKQLSQKCSKKCLVNITKKKILFLRFDAWSSNVYNERASWIIEHIANAYVVIDSKNEKDKFDFKLDGQSICNGCYALALGYSKRRLEELKWSIRSSTEQYAAIHGNSAKQPRALVQAEATRIAFERYTKDSGCPQPDRRPYRKKDRRMIHAIFNYFWTVQSPEIRNHLLST